MLILIQVLIPMRFQVQHGLKETNRFKQQFFKLHLIINSQA